MFIKIFSIFVFFILRLSKFWFKEKLKIKRVFNVMSKVLILRAIASVNKIIEISKMQKPGDIYI